MLIKWVSQGKEDINIVCYFAKKALFSGLVMDFQKESWQGFVENDVDIFGLNFSHVCLSVCQCVYVCVCVCVCDNVSASLRYMYFWRCKE